MASGKLSVFVRAVTAAAVLVGAAGSARAGGTPENILLVIDPTSPVSMYIGNYYRNARNIPESNVLYLRAAANNYADFRNIPQAAFLSTLAQRNIAAQIDYVVLATPDFFYVPFPGIITDDCFAVTRLSITSAFALAQQPAVPAGTVVETPNMFYSQSDTATAFDASQGYLNGVASTSGTAKKYFICSSLGYNGPFGNSTQQLIDLIDRSVAVDGTRPVGTFYYMNNTADADRNVRQPGYGAAVTAITSRSGLAQQLTGILPTNRTDVRGIMTGNADLDLAGANMVIQPGAFCDHLTSYAGTFDTGAQTKMTLWIGYGASGTAGTVEEPCNYLGKFPHPRFHVWYNQGMSLGEAYLRSMAFQPYQSMLYGDPMTRPWARFPTVSVTNMPTAAVRGVVALTTTSAATAPSAIVSSVEFLVDGVSKGAIVPSATSTFNLDTRDLDDGWHDLRVLAKDTSATKNMGRFVGSIIVNNHGRAVTLGVSPTFGDLAQAFTFTPQVGGGQVRRVQLVQGGRVIAGAAGLQPLTVYGANLGAGPSKVLAEVTYVDGRVARSAPIALNIGNSGTPPAVTPGAFSITKVLTGGSTYVVDFPGSFPDAVSSANFFQATSVSQSTVLNPAFTGSYRILQPNAGATGSETFRYRVVTAGGTSPDGTITIRYSPEPICQADFNVDGTVDADDLSDFVTTYFTTPTPPPLADFNLDGSINADDLADFITVFFNGCP